MSSGAQRYRELVSPPGARVPLVASGLGSLAIGMFILAVLLLAREATGSFADAGRVSGAFGAANALGAVAQGRLMDRLGQPRVLRAVAVGHVLAILAALSAGSLVGGLVYGARAWPGPPSLRLAVLLATLAAGCALLAAAALAAAATAVCGAAYVLLRRRTLAPANCAG
jgi:hypothetical protein